MGSPFNGKGVPNGDCLKGWPPHWGLHTVRVPLMRHRTMRAALNNTLPHRGLPMRPLLYNGGLSATGTPPFSGPPAAGVPRNAGDVPVPRVPAAGAGAQPRPAQRTCGGAVLSCPAPSPPRLRPAHTHTQPSSFSTSSSSHFLRTTRAAGRGGAAFPVPPSAPSPHPSP